MARMSAQERRQQLLGAAREEFLRLGPEGARISDIADRAGVNVALLYRYFSSKDQLFEESIVEPLDRVLNGMLSDTSVYGDDDGNRAHQELHLFYRSILQAFSESFELLGVVLFSERDTGHEFYTRRIAPFIDALADRSRAAGAGWPQGDAASLVVPANVGMCWGIVMDAHFRKTDLDLDEAAELVTRLTLGGVFGVSVDN